MYKLSELEPISFGGGGGGGGGGAVLNNYYTYNNNCTIKCEYFYNHWNMFLARYCGFHTIYLNKYESERYQSSILKILNVSHHKLFVEHIFLGFNSSELICIHQCVYKLDSSPFIYSI